MRIASSKLGTSHVTANHEADLKCRTALELKDRNEYDHARNAMFPLWDGVIGSRPNTKGLCENVVADVLLTTGILTGWLGSRNEIAEADGYARDLISESITLYDALGDSRKVAEARTELAFCYWRSGSNDEARILCHEALKRLTIGGNARANALILLSFVEWAEARYHDSLKVLTDNTQLFERITNHTFRGAYHNQIGIVLEEIGAASRKRSDYFQRAITEYHIADEEFKLAKNVVYRAHVKNNIANVLRELGRFREAHQCLEQARRLFTRVRDKVRVAQVDDTRAQVYVSERKYEAAEQTAHNAARSFARAGRQCLLAEALTTQGIAAARMGQSERAQFIFQQAIEIAHQAGSLNRAGLAALIMLEEVNQLPADVQSVAYEQAREWLVDSQSPDIQPRLRAIRKTIAAQRASKPKVVDVTEVLFNKRFNLDTEVLKFERDLISQALVKVNGQVTHAAKLLGVGRQRLAYIIERRHSDLLKKRSPVIRRPRKNTKHR